MIITTVWATAIVLPLFAIAPNPIALGVISACLYVIAPIYNAVQFSYRLSLIPDESQGRVNSAVRLIAFGFQPLGMAIAGVLLQRSGTTATVLLFSAITLALALATTMNARVRHARPLAGVAAEKDGL